MGSAAVRRAWGHITLLLSVLAATAALYAAGLPGGFVLDDAANLSGLDYVGDSAIQAGLYLAEAPTGFPGRPLSYLSFLAQRASWPADPQAFKIANIGIHLLNGVLVYALVSTLMLLRRERQGPWVALAAAAIWLVHPIQVSTVLYVVQRMTELAALFCLCAFLAYLKGRTLAAAGDAKAGYAWMSAALALGTPLAILAKESGVLLPLYVAAIEFTLLAGVPRPARWKLWAIAFIALTPIALALHVALSGVLDGYWTRSFGLQERLHTEARILWEYLGKIALPRPRALGIYFDDYPIAPPPWASLSTAAAVGGWCLAAAGAAVLRRTQPFLAFAILWFLAGHLLESTVIPLELYFEHRNYLPLLGPALYLAWGASRLWDAASSPTTRRLYALLGATAMAALGGVTWVEARTWSDPVRQTVLWAHENPTSQRAQYELGSAYVLAGRYTEARETFDRAQALAPDEAQFALSRLYLSCLTEEVALPAQAEVALRLARTPVRPGVVNVLDSLVERVEAGGCDRIDPAYALALVEGFLANPQARGQFRRAGLYYRARLHALMWNLDGAVRSLEAADDISPNLVSVQLQATWLLSAALYDDALRAVRKGRADPRWRPWQRGLYARFFDAWERQVREAARSKGVALPESES